MHGDGTGDRVCYQRNPAVLAASLGPDDTALLDAARESYFGLEGPASRIWELLERPATLDAICAKLVAEYEVDSAVCREETAALLGEMTERELLVCHPSEPT